MIATGWITILLFNFIGLIFELIIGTEYENSSRFVVCFAKQGSFRLNNFGIIIPIFISFCITITLDAYLSIKAYQVYKRIQKEEGEERKQMSKNKLHKALRQLKPMITLLITILGSISISVIASVMYLSALTVEGPSLVKFYIAKYTLPRISTTSTGVWSILQKDPSVIVQEVETHSTKLQI